MPLDSLLELVETLRERIDAHGVALRQSEALTRYALIDPLLRELGWDTDDPSLVVPEYKSGSGSADYALMENDRPLMMVEAKKLDTPLRDAVLSQGINYCLMEGTKHFTVTDGQRWEVYETHKPVPIDDKRIVAFDLKAQSPAEVCLKALALWRLTVESGHVEAGDGPVIDLGNDLPIAVGSSTQQQESSDQVWKPLTEVSATKGIGPVEILLPDGNATQVKSWAATLEASVRWLSDKGVLQESHCPIIGENPRAFRYMVHTQPFHSNGDPFKYPKEVNGLWVERHDNHHALISKTITIIRHVGHDPAHFKVRLTSP